MVTEASLIKEIEGHGLKILVVHEKYEQPQVSTHTGRMTNGVTYVQLFDRLLWERTPPEERKNLLPLVVGVANCSENDQFSRKMGRLIATGRALKAWQYKHVTPPLEEWKENDILMWSGNIRVLRYDGKPIDEFGNRKTIHRPDGYYVIRCGVVKK